MSKSPWTAERIATLKKLWAEGYTVSRIAKLMSNTTCSFTTNAIVGKRSRLKLPARLRYGTKARMPRNVEAAEVGTPPRKRKVAKATSQTSLLATPVAPTDSEAIFAVVASPDHAPSLVGSTDLRGTSSLTAVLKIKDSQCKWPIGDPLSPLFSFCAKKALANGSYCSVHDAQAHQVSRPIAPRTYVRRTV